MSDEFVQWVVNCDTDGFRTIGYSATGSAPFTDVTISGWRCFDNYLAELSAQLQAAGVDYTLAYNVTTDRLNVIKNAGTNYGFEFSESMADLLGFASTTTGLVTTTTVGHQGPKGVIPIESAEWTDIAPGVEVDLQTFRHGRAYGIPWGGSDYAGKLKLRLEADQMQRLSEGPCAVGKVRVGPYLTAAGAYTKGNANGWLYFSLYRRTDTRFIDRFEELAEVAFLAVASETHNASEDLPDDTWGLLKRGYAPAFYMTVEGLPFRFCEVDPGWSDPDRTVTATLLVDGAASLRHQVNKREGIVQGSGLRLAVHDPSSALGIFGRRPARSALLIANLSPTATSSMTVDDGSVFGSSDVGYLGKEFIEWASSTNTGLGWTLNTLTRGAVGQTYAFSADASAIHRRLTDVPTVWGGRIVELWVMALDPFGRPVGAAWDGDGCKCVYVGELESDPGYERGNWILETRDLMQRLATPLGTDSRGRLTPRAVAATDHLETYVYVDEDASVFVRVVDQPTGGGSAPSSDTQNIWDALVTLGYVSGAASSAVITYRQALEGFFYAILDFATPSVGGLVSDHLKSWPQSAELQDDLVMVRLGMNGSDSSTLEHLYVTAGPVASTPYWCVFRTVFHFVGGSDGDTEPERVFLGLRGRTAPLVVHVEDPSLPDFPSSGHVVLGEGDEAEVCAYTARVSLGNDRYALTGVTRGFGGSPRVNLFDEDMETSVGKLVTGGPGRAIAKLIESSGYSSLRGTYDVLTPGWGYGLDSSYVDDSTGYTGLGRLLRLPLLELVLYGARSLEELFSGLLAANNFALTWVRSGRRLKMGLVSTLPTGIDTPAFTLDDSALLIDKPAEHHEVRPGPNVVVVELQSIAGDGATDTVRVADRTDRASRGAVEYRLGLYGLSQAVFLPYAASLALGLLAGSQYRSAYKARLAPWLDYLPGQYMLLDVSYAGVWDFANQATGLQGTGRTLEVKRNLRTGEVEAVIIAQGQQAVGPLCPASLVTAASGADITVDDVAPFSDGLPILLYEPGDSSKRHYTTIDSIAGSVVTLSTAPSFTPTSNLARLTFGKETSLTAAAYVTQRAHVHVADGAVYQ